MSDGQLGVDSAFHADVRTMVALVVVVLIGAVATAAGVGGGAIYIPLFNALVGFALKPSTALSQACIVTSSLAAVATNLPRTHPTRRGAPLIDVPLMLLLTPVLLVGVGIGVLLNVMLPSWLLTVVLLVLLILLLLQAVAKGRALWRQETISKRAAASNADPSSHSVGGGGRRSRQDRTSASAGGHMMPAVSAATLRQRNGLPYNNPRALQPDQNASYGCLEGVDQDGTATAAAPLPAAVAAAASVAQTLQSRRAAAAVSFDCMEGIPPDLTTIDTISEEGLDEVLQVAVRLRDVEEGEEYQGRGVLSGKLTFRGSVWGIDGGGGGGGRRTPSAVLSSSSLHPAPSWVAFNELGVVDFHNDEPYERLYVTKNSDDELDSDPEGRGGNDAGALRHLLSSLRATQALGYVGAGRSRGVSSGPQISLGGRRGSLDAGSLGEGGALMGAMAPGPSQQQQQQADSWLQRRSKWRNRFPPAALPHRRQRRQPAASQSAFLTASTAITSAVVTPALSAATRNRIRTLSRHATAPGEVERSLGRPLLEHSPPHGEGDAGGRGGSTGNVRYDTYDGPSTSDGTYVAHPDGDDRGRDGVGVGVGGVGGGGGGYRPLSNLATLLEEDVDAHNTAAAGPSSRDATLPAAATAADSSAASLSYISFPAVSKFAHPSVQEAGFPTAGPTTTISTVAAAAVMTVGGPPSPFSSSTAVTSKKGPGMAPLAAIAADEDSSRPPTPPSPSQSPSPSAPASGAYLRHNSRPTLVASDPPSAARAASAEARLYEHAHSTSNLSVSPAGPYGGDGEAAGRASGASVHLVLDVGHPDAYDGREGARRRHRYVIGVVRHYAVAGMRTWAADWAATFRRLPQPYSLSVLATWVVYVVLQSLRSVVPKCSVAWWVLFILQIVVMLAISGSTAFIARRSLRAASSAVVAGSQPTATPPHAAYTSSGPASRGPPLAPPPLPASEGASVAETGRLLRTSVDGVYEPSVPHTNKNNTNNPTTTKTTTTNNNNNNTTNALARSATTANTAEAENEIKAETGRRVTTPRTATFLSTPTDTPTPPPPKTTPQSPATALAADMNPPPPPCSSGPVVTSPAAPAPLTIPTLATDDPTSLVLRAPVGTLLATLAAGLTGGLLGLGGGMVMGPLLLQIGVQPQVTAATSGVMVLFSSSAALIQFALLHRLNWQYAAIFGAASFVAGMAGTRAVGRAVSRSGRPSIVVLALAAVMAGGTVCVAVFGLRAAVGNLQAGGDEFTGLCATK